MDTSTTTDEYLLVVENLQVRFHTDDGIVQAVDGVSFHLKPGEALGLVGESGCGKSVTSKAIMRLIDPPGEITGGRVIFKGRNLLSLSEAEMNPIRGGHISMIFQQPQSALDPVIKVSVHLKETLDHHKGEGLSPNPDRVRQLLQLVEIPDPDERLKAYAHELSGGMAQRVMIAIALACNPELLIADEPTTALDVTIQAQILGLIQNLRQQFHTSVIMITHDLGIVATMTDRIAVMYAGQLVEELESKDLFIHPMHPYTQGLIRSKPMLGQEVERLEIIPGSVPTLINLPPGCRFAPRCKVREELSLSNCTESFPPLVNINKDHSVRCWKYVQQDKTSSYEPGRQASIEPASFTAVEYVQPMPIIKEITEESEGIHDTRANVKDLLIVENLKKYYPIYTNITRQLKGWVHALDDVSFTIRDGETLGLVGESGCGKTTVGRTIIRQIPATHGDVYFDGENIFKANRHELNKIRRNMQYIFQNPYTSLDPHMKVGEIIAEGLLIQGIKDANERREMVSDIIQKVGLNDHCLQHYPHQFSGGQRQRIGIARALAIKPRFLICDEPVSALDVSVQSQVLNLLKDLQGEFHLTYLFISHDLSVVEHLSDRVAVMYLGKLVELADKRELYRSPLHPYTRGLLAAIPDSNKKNNGKQVIKGDIPSPSNPPPGCRFATRCPLYEKSCSEEVPPFREVDHGHWVACFKA